MTSLLAQEEKLYEKYKDLLLKKGEGKYVVIQDEMILKFFETEEDALKEGYKAFKAQRPFLIRKVSAVDSVHYFSPSPAHNGIYRRKTR